MPGVTTYIILDPTRFIAGRRRVEAEGRKLSSTGTNLKKLFGTMFAGFTVGKVISDLVRVNMQFEGLRTTLETVFGPQAAARFKEIQDFAASTPFQVANLTQAWAQLAALGIDPTVERMTSLGNIAAAFGRDITDIAHGVQGAVTGEMEILKSFGIVARVEGDQLAVTFKGATRKIERDGQAILRLLEEIGSKDFAGGMDRQSRTLAGRLSTLKDAYANFLDQVGDTQDLKTAVESLTALITGASQWSAEYNRLGGVIAIVNAGILQSLAEVVSAFDDFLLVPENFARITAALDPLGISGAREVLDQIAQLRREIAQTADDLRAGAEAGLDAAIDGASLAAAGLTTAEERARALEMALGDAGDAGEDAGEKTSEAFDAAYDRISAAREALREFKIFLDELAAGNAPDLLPDEALEIKITTPEIAAEVAEMGYDAGVEFIEGARDNVGQLGNDLEGIWDRLGDVLEAEGQLIGEIIGTALADGAAGLAEMFRNVNLSQGFGAAFGGAGAAAGGILGALDLGRTGSAIAGGAAAGAQIGVVFGGVGAIAGAVIGAAVGALADMMAEIDQAFLDFSVSAEGMQAQLHDASGGLEGPVQDLFDAIDAEVTGILQAIGGTFQGWTEVGILLRKDSHGLRVAVNGAWTQFGDDVQAAADFIITSLLTSGNVTGVSDTVRAALEGFAGGTADELRAALDFALAIDELGIEDYILPIRDEVRRLFQLIAKAAEDFDGVGIGPGAAAVATTLGDAYNQLLGVQEPLNAQVEARFRALEAETLATIANLRALLAETEAKALGAEATVANARITSEAVRVATEAAAAGAQAQAGLGLGIATTAEVVVASTNAWSAASASIREAIAALEALDFGAEALAQAQRAAASAAGAANRAQREAAAEARRRAEGELALREAYAAGGEAAGDLLRQQQENEAWVRQMEEALGAEGRARAEEILIIEEAQRAITAAIDATRAALDAVAAFRDIVREDEFGAFGASILDLGDRVRAAQEQLREALAAGGDPDTLLREAQTIERALGLQIAAMLEGAVAQAAGDPEALRALQAQITALLGALPPELAGEAEAFQHALEQIRLELLATGVELGDLDGELVKVKLDLAAFRDEIRAVGRESSSLAGSLISDIQRWGGETAVTVAQVARALEMEFRERQISHRLEVENLRTRIELLVAEGRAVAQIAGLLEQLEFLDELVGQFEDLVPDFDALARAQLNLDRTAGGAASSVSNLADELDRMRDDAQRFLDQLAGLEQGQLDPLQQIRARFADLRDDAWALEEGFAALGVPMSDVLRRLQDLEDMEIANLFAQANEGLLGVAQSILGGSLSGLPPSGQAQAALAEIRSLIQTARGDDFAAIEARRTLAGGIPELLGLAAPALGAGGMNQLRQEMLAAIGSITGTSFGGGPSTGGILTGPGGPKAGGFSDVAGQIGSGLFEVGSAVVRASDREVIVLEAILDEMRGTRTAVGEVRDEVATPRTFLSSGFAGKTAEPSAVWARR